MSKQKRRAKAKKTSETDRLFDQLDAIASGGNPDEFLGEMDAVISFITMCERDFAAEKNHRMAIMCQLIKTVAIVAASTPLVFALQKIGKGDDK